MNPKDEVRKLFLAEMRRGLPASLASPVGSLALFDKTKKLNLGKFYEDLDRIIPWSELHQLQFSFKEPMIASSVVPKVVEILRWITYSWSSAVEEGDLEKVTIIFIVSERLFLKPEQDIDWGMPSEKLLIRIKNFLGKVKLDVGDGRHGPSSYTDRKFVDNFNRSVDANDFRGIFEFFRAMERGAGFRGESADFVGIVVRIACRLDVGVLSAEIAKYSPVLMKIVIDSIGTDIVLQFANRYDSESTLPLLICLHKVLADREQFSTTEGEIVWDRVREYAELVRAISTRTNDKTTVSYIMDCLQLSLNKQSNAILSTFMALRPNCVEDYVGKLGFDHDDSGEVSYAAMLQFADERITDSLSVKIYNAFFEYLERLDYKYHLFIFTSYYNYILRGIAVLSDKSYLTFIEKLEQVSVDLLRAISSWNPEKIAVFSTRWVYWIMCSKLFGQEVPADKTRLVYTYRILENGRLMKKFECTRDQILIDFDWLKIFLDEPDRLDKITIPLPNKAGDLVWSKNERPGSESLKC